MEPPLQATEPKTEIPETQLTLARLWPRSWPRILNADATPVSALTYLRRNRRIHPAGLALGIGIVALTRCGSRKTRIGLRTHKTHSTCGSGQTGRIMRVREQVGFANEWFGRVKSQPRASNRVLKDWRNYEDSLQ
jgi:hypothetical protein